MDDVIKTLKCRYVSKSVYAFSIHVSPQICGVSVNVVSRREYDMI